MPTGPNLWGVAGRTAGSQAITAAIPTRCSRWREHGITWTEENFVAYVNDPTGYLREVTGDNACPFEHEPPPARVCRDLYAYLAQFGPE